MRHTQTETLITRVKPKDPILYEILKNLNKDSLDISQAATKAIQQTPAPPAVDLSAINATLVSLQSQIDALEDELDSLPSTPSSVTTTRWVPVTTGDLVTPEIVFDSATGEVVVTEEAIP